MKLLLYFTFAIFISFILSCKKHKCPEPAKAAAKYEQNVIEFRVVNAGNNAGSCGKLIFAKIDTGNTLTSFKAVDLPAGITVSTSYDYKGKFEVLPEIYTCKDGRIDPRPGQSSPTINPHFVNILSWERK